MSKRLHGYVLAGGQSTRFGTDKATYVFDGQALALRAAERVAAVVAGPVSLVVATRTPAHEALGLRLVVDRLPGRGPLSGLDAALADAGDGYAVLVACDMPWLEPELLTAELTLLQAGPDDALVCCPRLGRWEPLHAVYRVAALERVSQALAGACYRMQDVVEALHPIDAVSGLAYPRGRWERSARSANATAELTSP